MNVKELKEQLEKLPEGSNDLEVYVRCTINPTGNIIDVREVKESTYGFFGKDIPCIIIEPSY